VDPRSTLTVSAEVQSRDPYVLGVVGALTVASYRPGEREAGRRRPFTADQQATRDVWARWRAEQGR